MIVFDNLRPLSEAGRAALAGPGIEITDDPVFVVYRRPPAGNPDLPVHAEITTDRIERGRLALKLIREGKDDEVIAAVAALTVKQVSQIRVMARINGARRG